PVRLGHITDVLETGYTVTVKVIDLDDRGKIRLTVKDIPQEGVVAERMAAVVEAGGSPKRERAEGDDDRGNRGGGDRGRGGDRGGRGGDRGGRGGSGGGER